MEQQDIVATTTLQLLLNAQRKYNREFFMVVDGVPTTAILTHFNGIVKQLFDIDGPTLLPTDSLTPVKMFKQWYAGVESKADGYQQLSLLEPDEDLDNWTLRDHQCFEHLVLMWRERIMGLDDEYPDYHEDTNVRDSIKNQEIEIGHDIIQVTNHNAHQDQYRTPAITNMVSLALDSVAPIDMNWFQVPGRELYLMVDRIHGHPVGCITLFHGEPGRTVKVTGFLNTLSDNHGKVLLEHALTHFKTMGYRVATWYRPKDKSAELEIGKFLISNGFNIDSFNKDSLTRAL